MCQTKYSTAFSGDVAVPRTQDTPQLWGDIPTVQGRFSWAGTRCRGGLRRQDGPSVHTEDIQLFSGRTEDKFIHLDFRPDSNRKPGLRLPEKPDKVVRGKAWWCDLHRKWQHGLFITPPFSLPSTDAETAFLKYYILALRRGIIPVDSLTVKAIFRLFSSRCRLLLSQT